MNEIGVAESISSEKFATRCRINALPAQCACADIITVFEKHYIGQTVSSLEHYLGLVNVHTLCDY